MFETFTALEQLLEITQDQAGPGESGLELDLASGNKHKEELAARERAAALDAKRRNANATWNGETPMMALRQQWF